MQKAESESARGPQHRSEGQSACKRQSQRAHTLAPQHLREEQQILYLSSTLIIPDVGLRGSFTTSPGTRLVDLSNVLSTCTGRCLVSEGGTILSSMAISFVSKMMTCIVLLHCVVEEPAAAAAAADCCSSASATHGEVCMCSGSSWQRVCPHRLGKFYGATLCTCGMDENGHVRGV